MHWWQRLLRWRPAARAEPRPVDEATIPDLAAPEDSAPVQRRRPRIVEPPPRRDAVSDDDVDLPTRQDDWSGE